MRDLQGAAANGTRTGNSGQPSDDHRPLCRSVRRLPDPAIRAAAARSPGGQLAVWLRSHGTLPTLADRWCEICSSCCGSINQGSVCLRLYPCVCHSRSGTVELHQSCTGVPFDSRLQRCVTTTADGEVLAISYRWRSDLQPAAKPRVQFAVVGAVLVGCVMLLAFF